MINAGWMTTWMLPDGNMLEVLLPLEQLVMLLRGSKCPFCTVCCRICKAFLGLVFGMGCLPRRGSRRRLQLVS